jgi:hypothetical protein
MVLAVQAVLLIHISNAKAIISIGITHVVSKKTLSIVQTAAATTNAEPNKMPT